MIKSLIAQLTAGKVSLTIALRQSKVILSSTSDKELEVFLERELNGYQNEKELPEYRIVSTFPQGVYRNRATAGKQVLPFDYSKTSAEFKKAITNRRVTISIPEAEDLLTQTSKGESGEIIELYPPSLLETQRKISKNSAYWFLESAYWTIHSNAIAYIVSKTNDKLIDILLRISKEYPHLEQELNFMMIDEENASKTYQTTINGNLIGSNFGVGDKQVQKDITINNNPEVTGLLNKIIELGFEKQDSDELSQIIDEEQRTGKSVKTKVFAWLGKMATKAVEKGIEHQIPTLIDLVTKFTHTKMLES